jgi:hypothetical protein
MVAAARKAFAYLLSGVSFHRSAPPPEDPHMVGEYFADYSMPAQSDLHAHNGELERLLQGTKVISAKREL